MTIEPPSRSGGASCPRCGRLNRSSARFCAGCGQELDPRSADHAPAAEHLAAMDQRQPDPIEMKKSAAESPYRRGLGRATAWSRAKKLAVLLAAVLILAAGATA